MKGMADAVPASPSSAPVTASLAALVARGALSADPLQTAAAATLDRIATGLGKPNGLFRKPKPVRGAYLVGSVGRGKTMLMDVFFAAVPIKDKRRVHFDEFMDEVHTAIADWRRAHQSDPIPAVTKPLLESTRLLCLDEFQVTDITNAMLLGRLFERLFAGGVTLVATSNTTPDDLYRDGLNRQLFLPFIDLLKAQVDIVPLDGPTDYRRLKFAGEEVYHFGTGPANRNDRSPQMRLDAAAEERPDRSRRELLSDRLEDRFADILTRGGVNCGRIRHELRGHFCGKSTTADSSRTGEGSGLGLGERAAGQGLIDDGIDQRIGAAASGNDAQKRSK